MSIIFYYENIGESDYLPLPFKMVEMRSIVRLDKEWPHPLIFEKVHHYANFTINQNPMISLNIFG